MRILLVKPHPQLLIAKRLQQGFLHLEPLELEIVAGGVPEGNEITICDLGIEKEPLEAFHDQLHKINPHIVGFTGYSSQSAMVKKLARLVKEHIPSAITVAGGVHATIIPADYAGGEIDIVVRGEGGTTFRELVNRYKEGLPLHFGDVSLSPQDPDFLRKAEAPPPEFPPVENIPRPIRDLVQRSKYFCVWTSAPENRLDTIFPQTASMRTSTGCAFNCSFCVVHHIMRGKYLQRTPEDVVDEISRIKEDNIYFVDDETFLNKKRMTAVAGLLLQRGIKKKYISWARSDTIAKNPELFQLWKKAGLGLVYVGLESMRGSQLDNYNKRTNVETNRKAISVLRETGITLHASFIVDPDFSVDDFVALEKEVLDLCPAEVTFTVFSPAPGTELFQKHKDDFICDPYLFYDCMHTILPTRLGLKKFYAHFARLSSVALRANPLRVNKVKVPKLEIARVIYRGTKYIFALRNMYKDYLLKT
ncbi:MAG: cobalamin B12-binding domain-containing protein [Nitrospirae bacterium]|nr:cobalamin B12-binding domain-containing protein [Nitrospirota bacterium]